MLPILKIILYETLTKKFPTRIPEPSEIMDDVNQIKSYVKSYEWGGPASALLLHHLKELSLMIRPGDVILDLACGPGPLLLELAALYPDCHFIGADLSENMLNFLEKEAKNRGLKNISILKEDICTLPSLKTESIDLIISTSALHHLPDEESLRLVFLRSKELLKKPNGGFYFFDFSLLKSEEARKLFVAEVAKLAPPITAKDYDFSLKAAFPFKVIFDFAISELPRPYQISKSAFVNFFYFIQSKQRTEMSIVAKAYINEKWKHLPWSIKIEHLMLRLFRSETNIR